MLYFLNCASREHTLCGRFNCTKENNVVLILYLYFERLVLAFIFIYIYLSMILL